MFSFPDAGSSFFVNEGRSLFRSKGRNEQGNWFGRDKNAPTDMASGRDKGLNNEVP